ncbi:hypothetical protein PG997_001410 [Apiospora hydei]|uniref:Uncharacterized protein n=1 Tax=Apiospora hydei TaxID=1337664 RepID=A0ABR1XDJ4_9PEZI
MCTTIKTKHHSCGHTHSQPSVSPSPSPIPAPGSRLRSRDDHRLLLQSTKWLPDPQPRVPPGMFQCAQNVATRPPAHRPSTPCHKSRAKREGKAKLHKKNKKSEPPPSSLLAPTTTNNLSPSAAAATPGPSNRVRSTSTATTTNLPVNERSPSRSLTPASMFRRAMHRDRAASEAPSLDVDLTRAVRDSFQKLSIMYGSGTPEPGRSRSVSAVSGIPEEGKDGHSADAVTDTAPRGKRTEVVGNKGKENAAVGS